MKFGFSPVQSEPTFEAMRAQAELAEALGFDTLWMHEHHSGATLYPCPLTALAAVADRTRRMRLGTNMLLLPLAHPLRVAQQAAMVDVLSGGRLVLGVSAGYAADEFAAFGVSPKERARRMEEGVTLIRALWTRPAVTADGMGLSLRDFSLFPRPVQQPPPIYMGAVSPAAVRRAARLADGFVLGAPTPRSDVRARVETYRRERPAGAPPGEVVLNRLVQVVRDGPAKAAAERFFTERFLHFYGHWGHDEVRGLDAPARTPEATAREHFVIGEPEECVDRIQEYAAMGVSHLACLMNFGGPDLDAVDTSMRLFAERVMPRLHGA